MVSTRGIKTKFSDGEKVLCYEPDPTKAKVLYESKVKDVIINKSKKSVEYLIHFRGWNSSWDRCVNEEYILKDTPENRQLQKDLADKSKLQFGAYLYRKDKERKKQGRKNSGAQSSVSEDANREREQDLDDGGIESMSEDQHQQIHHSRDREKAPTTSPSRSSCSDDEDCSVSIDEDQTLLSLCFSLELTNELRYALEQDYHTVTQDFRLHRIPAEPNVATILELYWRYYAANQLCQLHDRSKTSASTAPSGPASKGGKGCKTPGTNGPSISSRDKIRTEDVKRNLDICQEVLDGLRIYFDFTLEDMLLYNHELGQIETGQAIALPLHKVKSEKVKEENEDQEYAHLPSLDDDNDAGPDGDDSPSTQYGQLGAVGRRRSLRSYRSLDSKMHVPPMTVHHVQLCNATVPIVHLPITKTESEYSSNSNSSTADLTSQITNSIMSDVKIPSWRALPEYIYLQRPPPPSLLYGATHLARLFVKLPDLLAATNMSEEKLRIVVGQLEPFIEFLSEHREWFLDKCYIQGVS